MNNEFTQLWPQFSRFVEFEVPQNTFCDNSTNNNKTHTWHQIQIKSVQHLDSLYRLLQTLLNFVNFKLARSDICSCLLNTSTVNSAAAFYMAHCNKAFSCHTLTKAWTCPCAKWDYPVHGRNYGQMPFLRPSYESLGANWNQTQVCCMKHRCLNHSATAAPSSMPHAGSF